MAKVVIVGGGLSGLYAALLLEQRGVDYLLLESRSRFGGRVLSRAVETHGVNHARPSPGPRFDLGATWYWPATQAQLAALIEELGVATFQQDEDGDMLIERSAHRPASRVSGFRSVPPSMRVSGGMLSLIEALANGLSPTRLRRDACVRSINTSHHNVALTATDKRGMPEFFDADVVLLAVPPRLAASTIQFEPALPPSLFNEWNATETWMAPHAKYVATYPRRFWQSQGLSGEAQSSVGPLVEIHDASPQSGRGALFGFFGVPAEVRSQFSEDELKAHCRSQLVRLFGQEAVSPELECLKDWACDSFTATNADRHAGLHQANPPIAAAPTGIWRNRLIGIASEWSLNFPGYVAGAVDAASRGVDTLIANLSRV